MDRRVLSKSRGRARRLATPPRTCTRSGANSLGRAECWIDSKSEMPASAGSLGSLRRPGFCWPQIRTRLTTVLPQRDEQRGPIFHRSCDSTDLRYSSRKRVRHDCTRRPIRRSTLPSRDCSSFARLTSSCYVCSLKEKRDLRSQLNLIVQRGPSTGRSENCSGS